MKKTSMPVKRKKRREEEGDEREKKWRGEAGGSNPNGMEGQSDLQVSVLSLSAHAGLGYPDF